MMEMCMWTSSVKDALIELEAALNMLLDGNESVALSSIDKMKGMIANCPITTNSEVDQGVIQVLGFLEFVTASLVKHKQVVSYWKLMGVKDKLHYLWKRVEALSQSENEQGKPIENHTDKPI